MAYSSIVKKALDSALRMAQRVVATTINVVPNKADIVFTRLDNENSLRKFEPVIRSTLEGVTDLLEDEDLKHVILPVVPSELPAVERTYNHETVTGLNGEISLMGLQGLRRVVLDNYLLPSNPFKYPFCRPYGTAAQKVVDFLKKAQDDFIPLRITIAYHDGRTYLNMPCLVESFSYSRDSVDDMRITVNLVEYVILDKKFFRLKAR